MAELVGLVASIASLIQVSGTVAIAGYGYISAAKNAPKDAQKLCDELEALKSVLAKLEAHAATTSPQTSALSELSLPLQKCAEEVKELQSKFKPRSGVRKFVRRLKWPLEAGETSQAMSRIERHKSLFDLALTEDQLLLSKAIEVFAKNTDMAVSDLQGLVRTEFAAQKRRRQEEEAARAEKKRTQVLNWIYPDSFDTKHIEISTKRQEHTGKWLSQTPEYRGWIKEQPDSQLLWGHGIPGAGKTFLSSLVIDELEERALTRNEAVAHIYFFYKEQNQQTPISVVSSLIKQLIVQKPQLNIPKELEDLYDNLTKKEKRPTLENLQNILLTTIKLFSRVFFVFDALDECNEDSQRKELLPFFHQLAKNRASIFMTSRPHPCDIKESLSVDGVAKVELAAKEEDIRIYVEKKIEGNCRARGLIREDFREEVVQKLVDCSHGMFLLVHFCIEDLCKYTTLNQIKTALNGLKTSPRTEKHLDEIYNRAMDTVRAQHKSRERLAFKVLSWLVKAKRTLTVDEIRVAVSVEEDQRELSEEDMPDTGILLEVCAGLVIIDESSNTIQLAHYSVQEYLEGNSVIAESANLETAIACITFLLFNSLSQVCESEDDIKFKIKSHPFLSYAALQLSHHLQACDENLSANVLLLELLTNPDNLRQYAQTRSYLELSWFRTYEISPLYEASVLGHYTVVCQLLVGGADVSFKGADQKTALHVAAQGGYKEIVRVLLKYHADISVQDNSRNTPLHNAARNGHEAVVRLLLEKGADIEVQGNSNTPLHYAARNGHEAVVRLLLEKGADTEVQDNEGDTPLHDAARNGHEAVVRLLLEKGADTEVQNNEGSTPLHGAASHGHEAVVRLLLEKGADTEVQNNSGKAPLHYAAHNGHEAVVRLLLEKGADTEVQNNSGETPLHKAASNRHEAVVRLLLEKGADTEVQDNEGHTPLHNVTSNGHEAVVRLLLEKGADIEVHCNSGGTPLYHAASNGDEAVVRLLLERGADTEVPNIFGSTPLLQAASKRYKTVVSLLLGKSAGIEVQGKCGDAQLPQTESKGYEAVIRLLLGNSTDIKAQDGFLNTLLHEAASRGNEAMVRLLLPEKVVDIEVPDTSESILPQEASRGYEVVFRLLLEKSADTGVQKKWENTLFREAASGGHEAAVQLLLKRGADISARDSAGATALCKAAINGHENMVQLLIEKGANASVETNRGFTPLFLAAMLGKETVVRLLLKEGTDVLHVDVDGNSALHGAVSGGYLTITSLLLDHGADISVQTKNGRTALHYAASGDHEEIVRLLLERGADVAVVDKYGRTAVSMARNRDIIDMLKAPRHELEDKTKEETTSSTS